MAPWWLRSGNDETWIEDEAPGAGDDAVSTTAVPLAAEDYAQKSEPAEPAPSEPDASEPAAEDDDPGVETASETPAQPAPEGESAEGPPGGEPVESPPEEGQKSKKRRRRRRRRRRKPSKKDAAADAGSTPAAETPPAEPEVAPSPEPIPAPAPAPAPIVEVEQGPTLDVLRNLVYPPLPERSQSINDERKIAMFCDFENIALGVRDSQIKKLDVNLILERLLEKGKIIVKKAYADWERYNEYKKPFHEAAIELIDIPQKYYSGKNSADIKMVVDAMDLCYSKEHLDTFVLVSGDSDFSPLVSKLKENNKYVIGVGVKNSSSSLLIDNCDEFIYYEDLWRDVQRAARLDNLSPKDAEVFGLMLDAMFALNRENKDVLWGSMIKQTMQRKRPSFNEGYYGYRTFSELLEDAQRKNIIRLKRDQRSGNYVVSGLDQRR